MTEGTALNTARCLGKLVSHGWIPLRSMSVLLGYTHPTGIYSRQRGKKAIPTILVGGTYRVYADTVIETLEKHAETHAEDAEMILGMYRRLLKQHEQEKNNA